MKVFYQNYHISVNDGMVNDLLAIGLEVVVPTQEFAKGHISFFAPNDEHYKKPGVIPVNYDQFMQMEKMAIIINCSQLYDDMMKLYQSRGCKDTLILLSSQPGLGEWLHAKGFRSDYLISHELPWHRASKAKYKILYFNKPKLLEVPKSSDEVRRSFDEKKIKLYINHFDTHLNDFDQRTFTEEKKAALEFREAWSQNYGWRVPFYGFENIDGYLTMAQAQKQMKDSMFTLVFKGHETWGQMVNESMLIETPCIFLEQFITDMFTEYLITKDTAIIGQDVPHLIRQIENMSFEEYETLACAARMQSELFTEPINRKRRLHWLFDKVEVGMV